MVTSTLDLLTSASSRLTVPVTLLNPPRTVEIARWRMENCAAECAGSICQVEVAAGAGSEQRAASPAATAMRARVWPMFSVSFAFLLRQDRCPCKLFIRLHGPEFD